MMQFSVIHQFSIDEWSVMTAIFMVISYFIVSSEK